MSTATPVPSQPAPEKKVVPILLRLPESLARRLDRAAATHHRGRQVIIRDGLVAELGRLEAAIGPVDVPTAAALAEFRQVTGQDPAPVIRGLTRAHILRAQPDLKPAA